MLYTLWDDDDCRGLTTRQSTAKRQKRQHFLHGVFSAAWAWIIVCGIGLIYGALTRNLPATILELSIATGMALILSVLFWATRRTRAGAYGLTVVHAPLLLLIAYVISLIHR